MKSLSPIVIALVFFTGCTLKSHGPAAENFPSVAQREGTGPKQIYSASYSQIWDAAIQVAKNSGFSIHSTSPANGFIEARSVRPGPPTSIGIWVRETGEEATELEVVMGHNDSNQTWVAGNARSILAAVDSAVSPASTNN